jgi:hypothetical protein
MFVSSCLLLAQLRRLTTSGLRLLSEQSGHPSSLRKSRSIQQSAYPTFLTLPTHPHFVRVRRPFGAARIFTQLGYVSVRKPTISNPTVNVRKRLSDTLRPF